MDDEFYIFGVIDWECSHSGPCLENRASCRGISATPVPMKPELYDAAGIHWDDEMKEIFRELTEYVHVIQQAE